MSRQAIIRRERPTTRSAVHRIVYEYSLIYKGRLDPLRLKIYQSQNRQMAEMLGLKIMPDNEAFAKFNTGINDRTATLPATTLCGEDVLFSMNALKGEAEKARKRGDEYIGALMSGKHPKLFNRKKHKIHLPEHVRDFIKAEGLNPDAIETLILLTKNMSFTHRQVVYGFSATYDAEARARQDQYNFARPDYMNYEIGKIQINLPGNPKVRLIGKGVSIEAEVPQTLIGTMAGKKVSDVIEINGLEDTVIERAAKMKGTKILHLVLTPKAQKPRKKKS